MKHLDLFSGIGGFSLAADSVWEGVEHTFVENDPFCQSVLSKHWPNAEIHGDIKEFNATERFNLITGGFPCQPFSLAGKRKGTEDERHLWPEMLRVIKESRPTWVIGENVAGIKNLLLDQVLADLESAGYSARAFLLPACALNAPHKRDRFFIVAYADYGLGETGNGRPQSEWVRVQGAGADSFGEDWKEAATRLCGVDDGVSIGVDGDGKKKYTSRGKRLKALGNAIVPQIAAEIMRSMTAVDNPTKEITSMKQ